MYIVFNIHILHVKDLKLSILRYSVTLYPSDFSYLKGCALACVHYEVIITQHSGE